MQTRTLLGPEVVTDPVGSAKAVGLRYVSDQMPGIRRSKAGQTFRYLDAAGKAVGEEDQRRIKSLAIPLAWTDVPGRTIPSG
jgi:DNA topoisomerase I